MPRLHRDIPQSDRLSATPFPLCSGPGAFVHYRDPAFSFGGLKGADASARAVSATFWSEGATA